MTDISYQAATTRSSVPVSAATPLPTRDAGIAAGTAGSPSGGVQSVQGVSSGTPVRTQDEGPAAGNGHSVFARITTADTNAAVVKASAGLVSSVVIGNVSGVQCWVKLYNKATAPTVGTDVPVAWCYAGNNTQTVAKFDPPINFSTGIGIGIVQNPATADTTAFTANGGVVTIAYK